MRYRSSKLRRMSAIATIAAAALSLGLATARAQTPPPPPPPPPLTPLPPPPVPAGNALTAAKINLGKALFWDEQLSSTRTMACGSCHVPESGGSDRRSIKGAIGATNGGFDGFVGTNDDVTGSPGVVLNDATGAMVWSNQFGLRPQVTVRLAPSHVNAAYAPLLFWDGRAQPAFLDPITGAVVLNGGAALESQASAPPVSTAEMGHLGRDWSEVAGRVAGATPLVLATRVPSALASWIGGRSYPALFAEAFGDAGVTPARIAMAIASYERTQFSTQAPFDSVIAGTAALTPQEAAGMQLFGQVGCARCHGGALTSDNRFHYTGVRPANEDSGRAAVTLNAADLGAMRTPVLRNVALRPAFMHDGRFTTLDQVVAFYNRGGDFTAPNKDPLIVPLNLNPQQQAQLVAFLSRPLTDPRVASASAPFDRPSLYSESGLSPVLLPGGAPGGSGVVPQAVALEPPIRGNPSFTVGLYAALGGAPAVLVIDDAEPPLNGAIPASGSFARVEIGLSGSGPTAGWGSATLSIPDDPSLAGRTLYGRWYVSDPGAANGIAASASFRFAVFGENGSGVVTSVEGPTVAGSGPVRLATGYPNPFRAENTIRFELTRAARSELKVYDVSGRLVRRLVPRAYSLPGVYSSVWNGRDDLGRPVAAGVYFYRLETDAGSVTSRVVRLK